MTSGFSREWLIFKSATGPGEEIPYKALQSYPSRKNWTRSKCFVFVFWSRTEHCLLITLIKYLKGLCGIQSYPSRRNCKRKWNKWLIPVIQVLFLENRNFSYFVKNICIFKYPHFLSEIKKYSVRIYYVDIMVWNCKYYGTKNI